MTHGNHHESHEGCNHAHTENHTNMSSELERILYVPEKGHDFYIIAQKGMCQKWRDDPTHLPTREVVMTFQVFHKVTNNHGEPSEASKEEMTHHFGTDDVNEVIQTILKKGHVSGHCA